MVSVTKSQIRTEGGEKCWRWYGFTEPVDWCACFVSWCASEAGLIEEDMVPKFAEVNEGIRWFQAQGRRIDAVEVVAYKPTPGTLIFFDWEQDGVADHVGIVGACRNGGVYTIEGNSEDKVLNKYYLQSNRKILGYGSSREIE